MFKIFTKKGTFRKKIIVAHATLSFYLWCEVFAKTDKGLYYVKDIYLEWDNKIYKKVINVEAFL